MSRRGMKRLKKHYVFGQARQKSKDWVDARKTKILILMRTGNSVASLYIINYKAEGFDRQDQKYEIINFKGANLKTPASGYCQTDLYVQCLQGCKIGPVETHVVKKKKWWKLIYVLLHSYWFGCVENIFSHDAAESNWYGRLVF